MMATAQSPIKVSSETHQKIRAAAQATGKTQADVVGMAIDEFVGRHADELAAGLDRARAALAGGQSATVAYLLGVDAEAIKRVGGS
jgi:predicted transcriptional regulator